MKRSHTLLLSILVGGAACSTDVPDFQARLEADVTGDIIVHYEGDAEFAAAYNNAGLPRFGLESQNQELIGLPTEGFEAVGISGTMDRPREGSYVASRWRLSLVEDGQLWFRYQRAVNGTDEQYSSIGGTVEITYSSSNRLEGTFDIEALLFCRRLQGSVDSFLAGSCHPGELDYSLPTIRVVGSFTARKMPDDLEVINQPGSPREP